MVQQATAVEGVRLPVWDLRSSGQGRGVTSEGLRDARVAGLHGEANAVGEQVLDLLDLLELLAVVGKTGGQRGECLGQRVGLLVVETAGEGQRAEDPVPDP